MIPTYLRIVLPGEPFSQKRARHRVIPGQKFAHTYDPKENSNFKATCQAYMSGALEAFRAAGGTAFPANEAPLLVEVLAIFPCPKSEHRKTMPRQRRWHTGNKDWDNLGKAVCDAGTGVLWKDDHTVSVGSVTKIVGAQTELPRTIILVREIGDADMMSLLSKFEVTGFFGGASASINAALKSIEEKPATPVDSACDHKRYSCEEIGCAGPSSVIDYAAAAAELDERDGFES